MPWAWAMPHMIAGVTAPPRWQWSSASGILRESCRAIGLRIAAERPAPDRPVYSQSGRYFVALVADQLDGQAAAWT